MKKLYCLLNIFLLISGAWPWKNYIRNKFSPRFGNSGIPRHERHQNNPNRQARVLAQYLNQMRILENGARDNILGYYQNGYAIDDPREEYYYRHPLLLLMEIQEQISSMNERESAESRLNQIPDVDYQVKDSTKEAILRNSWPGSQNEKGRGSYNVYEEEKEEPVSPHHRGSRDVNSVINTTCHVTNLKRCGRVVLEGVRSNMDFSSRCKIRKDFLDCMVRMREKGCDQLSSVSVTEGEDAATIRNEIRRLLRSSNGCVLGYEA